MNTKQFNEFHEDIRDILRPRLEEIKSFRVTHPGYDDSKVVVKFLDGTGIKLGFKHGHWVEV